MNNQTELFQAMARPDFYPHQVIRIEQRETHISRVFLTGNYVYKIKKSIDLGFLNYTTLSKRKYYCQQETTLNRRLSQGIYLGVVPISLENGCYVLDGPGQIVEYAVKMRQLPEQCTMMHLLQERKIEKKATEELAVKLSEFYNKTPTGDGIDSFGALDIIRDNCEENFQQIEKIAGNILDPQLFENIIRASRSFLQRRKKLFESRIEMGKIRDCHGDLRSGHIYWIDGIQIIDCIEFNERFRYSDIASDLAFLLMDIEFRGFADTSWQLLDYYVRCADDPTVFLLLDFYKCYRAMVRTKVDTIRLTDQALSPKEKNKLNKAVNRYLNLAYQYALSFSRPCLWIICGMVATGKSTIASELAGILGVEALHSDNIRKDLFGVSPENFMDPGFEKGIYSRRASTLTYDKLLNLAREEISRGSSVIVDATFSSAHSRTNARLLAREMEANSIFVECTAPEEILKNRLLQRETTNTVSDARLRHLPELKNRFEPFQGLTEGLHISIDTQSPIKQNIMGILSQAYSLFSRIIQEEPEIFP